MHFIAGLGNPGKQYENTRHNLGFMIIDALAKELGLAWQTNKKFKAELAKNPDLILIKPQTFMNNSGFSIAAALAYFKLSPKRLGFLKIKQTDLSNVLTVVHDDLDIELGKYKVSSDSRSAGHQGVQSIIDRLKTKNFKRIRIGIRTPALPRECGATEQFVLQKLNDREKTIISNLLPEILPEILKKL
jgi:PTH1 family peptidyl-tRNA hydrolase